MKSAPEAGFSLLQLLFAISLAALILALAVPAFGNLVLDSRLTATVNRFVHGMYLARYEAEKRGREVVLCRTTDARQCNHAAAWASGYLVFVNRDRDDPPRVDPGESILEVVAGFPDGTILSNRRAFVFRPFGTRSVNGTVTVCDRRGFSAARAIVVSYTGRPRAVSARDADGAINCPG